MAADKNYPNVNVIKLKTFPTKGIVTILVDPDREYPVDTRDCSREIFQSKYYDSTLTLESTYPIV